MDTDYILNFTIPQGPTGPTGPQGEIGPTGPSDIANKAYGYATNLEIYSTQPVVNGTFLPNKAPTQVQLPGNSYKVNVEYTTNAIKLLKDGYYEVKYSILLKVPSASVDNVVSVTLAIRGENYDPTPSSFLTIPLQDSAYHLFTYSIFQTFGNAGGDIGAIDLVIFADKPVDYTYTSAYLSANLIADLDY